MKLMDFLNMTFRILLFVLFVSIVFYLAYASVQSSHDWDDKVNSCKINYGIDSCEYHKCRSDITAHRDWQTHHLIKYNTCILESALPNSEDEKK